MELNTSGRSPREEGELEDGEICDDDTDEKQFLQRDARPSSNMTDSVNLARCNRKGKPQIRALPVTIGAAGPDFRVKMPFNRGSHPRPPFLPSHRLPGGPSGPDRPLPGQHCDPGPRSSFWERSHTALGRLRYRGKPHQSRGAWNRGPRGESGAGRENGRPPPSGRFEFGKDSPGRKQKVFGRTPVRKPMYNFAKAENGVDESFEDLLMKYKQIQLELECIRKEEKMAMNATEGSPSEEAEASVSVNVGLVSGDSIHIEMAAEEPSCPEKVAKKVFQAFSLRPLRQKLPTPAERDKMNKKPMRASQKAELDREGSAEPVDIKDEDEEVEETDISISCVGEKVPLGVPVKGKDEDDELSELQLRLLALQSASKKWQQKEQQVMKESKEKIIKAKPVQEKSKASGKAHLGKKNISPGSAAKQAWRKQQLRNWKLQQQKEHEEQRRQEEEERRKREDEIRRIRDLSNQDEQYNRFMKLVGGRRRSRSKSLDPEHRRSLGKQGLDSSGSLYQYDNYDEVAMDTDSETNTPASSPTRVPFSAEGPPFFHQMASFLADSPPRSMAAQDVDHRYTDAFALPPPLPPLPPDEPEQPPKPPFADEEEEEEMLLREELLKSLASKRAVKSEETSSNSGPPSPLVGSGLQAVPKSSPIAVPQARPPSAKFAHGHPASRPLLVLPRHKSVVVHLKASDDSDSEGDAPGSAPTSTRMVFGGLESMIKEARRTAEAAKPKGTSGSEKENNPMRTPDALPEAKKIEYRRLKEEIASREKQRALKCGPVRGVPSPANSDVEPEVMSRVMAARLQVTEAENRVTRHKNMLLRDEMLLKNLLQQELKKKELLKAAEAKVSRLREQLLASEKIVSANRVFLKKLQEQIHRVQHRISVKKHQAQKLEKDLVQAQATAVRAGAKRRSDARCLSPSKVLLLDGSPRTTEQQFAELIAQKQRLQQLESEYALKIKKLKEAQALRNREVQAEPPPALTTPQSPTPATFPLPQPSLHDLTQDKLALASEEPEAEDEGHTPCHVGGRRRSFRESGSFTKPQLRHLEVTPGKATPCKAAPGKEDPSKPELFLGLSMDELQRMYQRATSLTDMMEEELSLSVGPLWEQPSGKDLPMDLDLAATQPNRAEPKPIPFGLYHSPLLVFKSYRFSPYFRTKEKLSLSSLSYSNAVEPKKCFCRFDLTGTCNDDGCPWQHIRDCSLKGNQLFQDILSYNLSLIGCSETSSSEEISVATEKYINKLFGPNKGRMGTDQKAVLLVSKVNESKRHVPPYTTCKERRKWRPRPTTGPDLESGRDSTDDEAGSIKYESSSEARWAGVSVPDTCITQDDDRYFTGETDDISNLETSVLESPKDVQLWIKLAYKYLSQKESLASECLDAALNTLSRALEHNRDHPEVWCHYLTLFARRGQRDEVQEMCEMAVEYAPNYEVWWTYLNLESSFEGKDYICLRLLQYLQQTAGGDCSELQSFRLLESLLYRVQLSLFCGRLQNARALLQNALKPAAEEKSLAERLTTSDRCLAWLSLIHLSEFGSLPLALYDPADSNPSRVVSREPFLLPWRSVQDIRTPPEALIALFEDAIRQCDGSHTTTSLSKHTLACLPLFKNLIVLYRLLGRMEQAVPLCEALLQLSPQCCPLLEAFAELHKKAGEADKAVAAWLDAVSKSPRNAEVVYFACKFLVSQEKVDAVAPLIMELVASFCDGAPSEQRAVHVLRYILGIPSQDTLHAANIRKELQDELAAQMPYLYLLHCLWQCIHGSIGDAVDAFERALGTVMQEEVVQLLWMDYLLFTSSKFLGPQSKGRDLKSFKDLVYRCLATVPTRITVPFSSDHFWSCFTFHNKVISFYLGCLPQSLHSTVLESLRYLMPTNSDLALRFLQSEWQDGSVEHVKLQTRMLSSCLPNCLANWKIAIAVQKEIKGQAEVRHLYRQALRKLPLCATLWKDRLLFEATEGGKTDKLRKLVDTCQEVGVSLGELLNLGSERTQKDH